MGNGKHHEAYVARKVTWIGLIVNVILSAFKLVAGIIGHSQAMVADGVHSISDLTTDVAVLIGIRYWSTPADEDHPYGHERIESLVTAFVGV
ncbi:MAG: cation transporter, partial [Spirochaetes bacterium]|nr:cation transporter [Spirochaetota bacterium]